MHASPLRFLSAIFLTSALPAFAHAQTATISQVVGLFNVAVGVMFAIAVTTFFGGLISYVVYFGNFEREKGVGIMEWGVSILFVLVVLLGIVGFLQNHAGVTNVIAGLIVVVAVAWVVFTVATTEQAAPKEGPKKF